MYLQISAGEENFNELTLIEELESLPPDFFFDGTGSCLYGSGEEREFNINIIRIYHSRQ
jgi:hypothetical protein